MTKSIIQWAMAVLLLAPLALSAQVTVGGTTPDPSAVVDMQSTDKGFLWPRLTTSERNAISSPATGLIIFNTNTLCIEINQGTPAIPQWERVKCRTGIISSLNCAGTSVTGLTINIPYTGGNGGVYDEQSAASTGITGLSATLPAGNYADGSGSLSWLVSGVPSGPGTATFSLSSGGFNCSVPFTVVAGTISALDCAGASITGTLTSGQAASGVSASVPYTGGNGGPHSGQSVVSTGVTGLTATLSAGSFVSGAGSLSYAITGTPASGGTASFALSIGGQTCTLNITVLVPGSIGSLNCSGATVTGTLTSGQAASGVSASVPYTGGDGGIHDGQVVTSTGVTGLTATLSAGNFGSGAGNLSYAITGTPASGGTASFALNIGGQTCTLDVTVLVSGTIGALNCSGATVTGTLAFGQAASGVSASVPYTGGNGGFHSGQTVTSTGVTGLTATLSAGNFGSGADSLSYAITGTPASGGTASFALSIGGQTCTLDVTVSSTPVCRAKVTATEYKNFLCYNLGAANTSADPFTPSWEINGGYWQWGRSAEAAAGPTATDPKSSAVSGWNTTAATDGSWADGSKTGNDPCPTGYRVPTRAQWDGVVANNSITNVGTFTSSATNYGAGKKFGDQLMLPAAGLRNSSNGALLNRGINGYYWSSTTLSSGNASLLNFSSSNAGTNNSGRNFGLSVRCIAE